MLTLVIDGSGRKAGGGKYDTPQGCISKCEEVEACHWSHYNSGTKGCVLYTKTNDKP